MRDDFNKQTIETLARPSRPTAAPTPAAASPPAARAPSRPRRSTSASRPTSPPPQRAAPATIPRSPPSSAAAPTTASGSARTVPSWSTTTPLAYPVDLLQTWKRQAEETARQELERRGVSGDQAASSQVVHTGSGGLAQNGSVAAGEGGVAVDGDVHGDIRIGG